MTVRGVVVGDPHARVEDLDECGRLVEYVAQLAERERVDFVLLTGDLYHTHEVIRAEVAAFWRRSLARLSQVAYVVVVRGNHDGPHGDEGEQSALGAHHEVGRVRVFTGPGLLQLPERRSQPFAAVVPYAHDRAKFVEACVSLRAQAPGVQALYCHQSFDGARFDNGFYDPEGVDPALVPFRQVVSGHVHSGQEFNAGGVDVWYVGSPRWLTASDANRDKSVWLVEHADDGTILSRVRFDTRGPCRKLVELVDSEDAPVDVASLDPADRLVVEVRGTEEWCESRKSVWRGRARWRSVPTRRAQAAVRESEGVAVAFRKYLAQYVPPGGTPPATLEAMVRERLPEFAR